jgi:23S rRNA (cytosine1962-C5)-methyltransferase
MKESVILKKGKEKAIQHRHHWIFSGAIKTLPSFENGSVLRVVSSDGKQLGSAYFNRQCSIAGRMIAFGENSVDESLEQRFKAALELREQFFSDKKTTAYALFC